MTEPVTVRDHIKAIQAEVGRGDLQPTRAAQILMEATALVGNVGDEIITADAEFNLVYQTYLDSEEKANRARIRAEGSPAYARRQQARHAAELLKALIASIKYFLRHQAEEMRLSR